MRFFLLFILISQILFSQNTLHENWKCINDSNYSIYYPDSIELDMSPMMQSSFALFFPVDKTDLFRTNINLLIQDLKGSHIENLEQFAKISEKQIITLVTQGTILESKLTNINNINFYKLVFTGIQNQYFLKWAQYYAIQNHKAYILTFTSTINQFSYYEDIQNQIVSTFKIK